MTKRQRMIVCNALPALMMGLNAQNGLAEEPTTKLAPISAPTPVATPATDSPEPAPAAAGREAAPPDTAQIECVAKVIVHEAGNQPREGQIAVAQVIRTRLRARRYGTDACTVIGQPGQFFDVDTYRPSRGDARWSNAVAIASRTLAGEGEELVPGALFFHAVSAPMAKRVRVAQIADHIFYR